MTDCDANSQYVQIGRRAQPAQPGLGGRMPDVEVVQHVRLGERATGVDELIGDAAESLEPFRVDEIRDGDPAAPLVVLALGLTEDRGVEHPKSLFQRCMRDVRQLAGGTHRQGARTAGFFSPVSTRSTA